MGPLCTVASAGAPSGVPVMYWHPDGPTRLSDVLRVTAQAVSRRLWGTVVVVFADAG